MLTDSALSSALKPGCPSAIAQYCTLVQSVEKTWAACCFTLNLLCATRLSNTPATKPSSHNIAGGPLKFSATLLDGC